MSPPRVHPLNTTVSPGGASCPVNNVPIIPTSDLPSAQAQWRKLLRRDGPSKVLLPQPINRPLAMTVANARANNPWGDELDKKDPTHVRVYASNVNGLQLDERGGQFDCVCKIHKEVQADVICGQEHNLDTTQAAVRTILYKTARQHWQRHRLTFGTSPIPFKTYHKPGGTFIMTTGNITGRVTKQESDKWGRWSSQEYQGHDGHVLVIYSVYQPVEKRGVQGKTTVAAQQRSLLLLSKDSTSDPRTAFRRDLLQELKTHVTQGRQLLVMGDFNEQLGTDADGISHIVGNLGLLDVMASRHSMIPPATYARGSKCLDYALATPQVCSALKKCGYDAFNARLHSDHRGYYFDFDAKGLFGSATQDLAPRNHRGLVTSSIAHVTSYIRHKYELLENHNAFIRSEKLLHPGLRHQYAERLDMDVLAASLAAETALPVYDEPAWSVTLVAARKRVTLLAKCLSALKTNLDPEVFLQGLNSLDTEEDSLPSTIAECSKKLREAKAQVQSIVSESFAKRDSERQQRIAELELSNARADKDRAKVLRRLKKAEDIKELFKKIRHIRTKNDRRGVTRIEIPKHPDVDPKICKEWIQVDVPTEIVNHLQARNQKHFGQAHGTPFTVSPLLDHMGYRGEGPGTARILDGTFDYSDYDSNVQLLLQHLQHVEEIVRMPATPTITEQEYTSKLKVWSESTTTSPSGMHLGHYKTLIARHSFSSDAADDELTPEFVAQRDELNFKQGQLLTLHLRLTNYALERGYSYRRWHSIANTILFKDSDNVRLHRTRVIHIYEADFNLALGVKWRAAMHKAEDCDALNDGQYGSRPHRNATEPVFIEELQCEIARATRKQLILTNYDATACYDRIIPNLAMVTSQKFGVAASVTHSNARTLQLAEYKVRTELGLAKQSYSHSDTSPIYGTGQGSANSPAIWCFLSSTLFDCYDTQAAKASYRDSNGQGQVELGLIGFVDDCNGQTNQQASDGAPHRLPTLLAQTQHNAQKWTDLLNASGGALELSKCSCHILQWQFSMQGAPILAPSIPKDHAIIKVWDSYLKQEQSMTILSAYQAHKTLGHYKDPAGTQVEQFRQLQKKSNDVTSFLWKVPLTRAESWTFYYACYLPAITYPLPCSSLTPRQLDQIQRQAMKIIVARCGFNRNTRKEVLYGPLELGGASFRHIATEQGIGQTTMFLRNWRRPHSIAGKLLRVAMSWFQQQIGTSIPFLEEVHTPLPHLESKWVRSLRSFLSSIDASIRIDNARIKPLQRNHDFYIMDAIIKANQFTLAEIRRLNYCRLYLQALTASDLTETTGRTLDTSKLNGHPSRMSSMTIGEVIYQERPADAEWKLWKRANRLWSYHDNTMVKPLGMWFFNCHQLHQQHQSYMSAGDVLWTRHGTNYVKCREYPRSPTQLYFRYGETHTECAWEDLPDDSLPAEAQYKGRGLWRQLGRVTAFDPVPTPNPVTFPQYVSTLEAWEIELLEHTCFFADPRAISVALEHGIRAVSDGSEWYRTQGSFGWAMSDDVGHRVATGTGPARSQTPYSYRSESYGMLSLLCFLKRLAEFTNQWEPWRGTVATDSQSLIDTLHGKTYTNADPYGILSPATSSATVILDPLIAEWDIIFSIQTLLREMPGLSLIHVRGHQDKKTPYHRLPLLAQLNVDADELAGDYQRDKGAYRPDVLLTTWTGAHLQTPTGTITAHYASALRHLATYRPLWKVLQTKHKWTDTVMRQINWKAHGTMMKKQIARKTHLVKALHGFLPTNKFLHKRGEYSRRLCPACRACVEDRDHVMQCEHTSRTEWKETTIQVVSKLCKKLGTRPILQALLETAIHEWITCPPATRLLIRPHRHPDELTQLICQQNLIGWHHMFSGRFSQLWADLQDTYHAREKQPDDPKQRTGQRWQVLINSCLLDQWFEVWKQRNQEVHGHDAHTRDMAARAEVERRLRALYAVKEQMEPSVQVLFYNTVESHFVHTLIHNQNWLAIHEPLGISSIRTVRSKAIQGVPSIRRFLHGST